MAGLRERLHDGKPFLFSWMSMPGAHLVGQVARLPLDGVTIDLQHGLIDFADAAAMVSAINAVGKPAKSLGEHFNIEHVPRSRGEPVPIAFRVGSTILFACAMRCNVVPPSTLNRCQ